MTETVKTLRGLVECASAWDPDARLLGNLRAEDIATACRDAAELLERNCRWHGCDGRQWFLMRPDGTSAATVWHNGTWHTWDRDGVGGENDVEADVGTAMREAAESAIKQGFL